MGGRHEVRWPVVDYDLGATLNSGQAFRWEAAGTGWRGVIGSRWVELGSEGGTLRASTPADPGDWSWLRHYLQIDVDLGEVLRDFPDDPPLVEAVRRCRGLRLLRQEPWECLASFLLSSTKQIFQIREGVRLLCDRFGEAVVVPVGVKPMCSFPSAGRLARASESELRSCRIGFRAKYLRATAEAVASGAVDLNRVGGLTLDEARTCLTALPGVGPKIADCVLLFAYGFADAFPVDVWVLRAMRELYFEGREPSPAAIRDFSATHFHPRGGYAQQYLFHYMRLHSTRSRSRSGQEARRRTTR